MVPGNPNSFDLMGDGDDVDVIEMSHAVFGITISDTEAEAMRTFGDLGDKVERSVSVPDRPVCLLRRAFVDVCAQSALRLHPRTRVDALGDNRLRVVQINTCRRDDLDDSWETTDTWKLAALGAAILAMVFWGLQVAGMSEEFLVLLGVTGACCAIFGRWRDQRRSTVDTVGDLLRAEFHHHYQRLAPMYGPGYAKDRWTAPVAICRAETSYAGRVDRDTTFFSNHFPQGAH